MKKNILLFILIGFSILLCNSQSKKNINIDSVRNELLDSLKKLKTQTAKLEIRIISFDSIDNRKIAEISKNADSLSNSILGKRLNETLKTADKTISYQSSFIQIFDVLIAILALIAAISYFFSIRPVFKQANVALERANDATDRTNRNTDKFELKIEKFNSDVDLKLKEQFDLYEKKMKEENINQIFEDIKSDLPTQRKLQIERLSLLNPSNIDSTRIVQLTQVLDSNKLCETEKALIVETLMQIDTYQTNKFLETWNSVGKDEFRTINSLYLYYMRKGFRNYLYPIRTIILNRIDPNVEFNKLLDMIPSHPEDFLLLINDTLLISSLTDESKKSVIDHINKSLKRWGFDKIMISQINESHLLNSEFI